MVPSVGAVLNWPRRSHWVDLTWPAAMQNLSWLTLFKFKFLTIPLSKYNWETIIEKNRGWKIEGQNCTVRRLYLWKFNLRKIRAKKQNKKTVKIWGPLANIWWTLSVVNFWEFRFEIILIFNLDFETLKS